MSVQFQYGNLLDVNDVDVICHQVNCLAVRPHGLSLSLSKIYPWGDIYGTRVSMNGRNLATHDTRGEPGTVKTFKNATGFTIACLQAQWDYGSCDSRYKRKVLPHMDTTKNRKVVQVLFTRTGVYLIYIVCVSIQNRMRISKGNMD